MKAKGVALLKDHEGLRTKPYRCTAGKLTIGYGINLDDGITEYEAEWIMLNRVSGLQQTLLKYSWYSRLDDNRKDVIANMAYNLGVPRFLKFKRMIAALEREDYFAKIFQQQAPF